MQNLSLNHEDKIVIVDGEEIHLTTHEYNILKFLKANPNCYYSADQIYENAWNDTPFDIKSIISVHIRHLREKIERDPSNPTYITTKIGVGYQFSE